MFSSSQTIVITQWRLIFLHKINLTLFCFSSITANIQYILFKFIALKLSGGSSYADHRNNVIVRCYYYFWFPFFHQRLAPKILNFHVVLTHSCMKSPIWSLFIDDSVICMYMLYKEFCSWDVDIVQGCHVTTGISDCYKTLSRYIHFILFFCRHFFLLENDVCHSVWVVFRLFINDP